MPSQEHPLYRGLVLAVVLGVITFGLGWQRAFQAVEHARPVEAQTGADMRARDARAARGAAAPIAAAPAAPSRAQPAREAASIRSTGPAADPRPERTEPPSRARARARARAAGAAAAVRIPEPASALECNGSLADQHVPAVVAAESASPAAFRSTRVLPTLFVPCCPKAGTTFIHKCASYAFHPKVVCHSPEPAAWADERCAGRAWLLSGLRPSSVGMFHDVKEPFFFNKDVMPREPGAARDLASLAGPRVPLCLWAERNGAPPPPRGARLGTAAMRRFFDATSARVRALCNISTELPAETEPYLDNGYFPKSAWPGCRRNFADAPTRERTTYRDSAGFKIAFPLSAELPAGRAQTLDMTPNYLCSPHALRVMRERYGPDLSRRARFIVMLRDPVSRAFSEYGMFRTWGWEKNPSFESAVAIEAAQVRACYRNDTLFARPQLIAQMRPADVVSKLMRCGSGDARQYVRNSLYEVCVAGAYAYFERAQFMFMFSEDLREMGGQAILDAVASFTGLSLRAAPDGTISSTITGRCETGHKKRSQLPNHQTRGTMPAELRAKLGAFFAPSMAALEALVAGSFADARPLARLRQLRADALGARAAAAGGGGPLLRDVDAFTAEAQKAAKAKAAEAQAAKAARIKV